jgi:hypothetical protein
MNVSAGAVSSPLRWRQPVVPASMAMAASAAITVILFTIMAAKVTLFSHLRFFFPKNIHFRPSPLAQLTKK